MIKSCMNCRYGDFSLNEEPCISCSCRSHWEEEKKDKEEDHENNV